MVSKLLLNIIVHVKKSFNYKKNLAVLFKYRLIISLINGKGPGERTDKTMNRLWKSKNWTQKKKINIKQTIKLEAYLGAQNRYHLWLLFKGSSEYCKHVIIFYFWSITEQFYYSFSDIMFALWTWDEQLVLYLV